MSGDILKDTIISIFFSICSINTSTLKYYYMGDMMNLNNILSIMGDENIDKQEIFKLVDDVRNLDLTNEDNVRTVIRRASAIANRDISQEKEDEIVSRLATDGMPQNFFDMF